MANCRKNKKHELEEKVIYTRRETRIVIVTEWTQRRERDTESWNGWGVRERRLLSKGAQFWLG